MTENQSDSEYYQHLKPIIDEAYSLYMPQVRSEITKLYRFLNQHYGLKKSEPFNVLEIGTKFGGTFFLWCSMNQSSGLNISIDMDDGGKHGGIGTEKMDERDEWFQERFDNCKFIRGNSHDAETGYRLLGLLYPGIFLGKRSEEVLENSIDFLFIDGDHTYEGVKQDFLDYEPFVKKGGLICFHDIKDTQRHRERDVWVANFWNEIQDKYTHYEFCDKSFDWGGIGCMIKH